MTPSCVRSNRNTERQTSEHRRAAECQYHSSLAAGGQAEMVDTFRPKGKDGSESRCACDETEIAGKAEQRRCHSFSIARHVGHDSCIVRRLEKRVARGDHHQAAQVAARAQAARQDGQKGCAHSDTGESDDRHPAASEPVYQATGRHPGESRDARPDRHHQPRLDWRHAEAG